MRVTFLILAALLAVVALPPVASAHHWYPDECCHDRDCSLITLLERTADGGLRIVTAHGVGFVPPGFPVRPSLDNAAHACLIQNGPDEEHLGWTVVCLFFPGAV